MNDTQKNDKEEWTFENYSLILIWINDLFDVKSFLFFNLFTQTIKYKMSMDYCPFSQQVNGLVQNLENAGGGRRESKIG